MVRLKPYIGSHNFLKPFASAYDMFYWARARNEATSPVLHSTGRHTVEDANLISSCEDSRIVISETTYNNNKVALFLQSLSL